MIYLKSALVGLLVAVLASMAWLVPAIVFAFQGIAATGSGGLGAVSLGVSELALPFLLAWLAGFLFMLRRYRRRAAAAPPVS